MTTPQPPSPPGPPPATGKSVWQYLRPLRDLAVYALAGVPAVLLATAVLDLFGDGFLVRTQYSFGSFVNLATIFMPLAAVVLSLAVQPVHPKARVIALVTLVEYGVAAFFGLVFGVFFGVSNIASTSPWSAFLELLARAAWLALFALVAYAVWQIWGGMFAAPRPQPGVYGQPFQQYPPGPPPGWQGYPGPQGPPPGPVSGPPPGYPAPPPGFAPPGFAPAPGFAAPPAWNQPPPPGAVYPVPQAPVDEPTRVVPGVPSEQPVSGPGVPSEQPVPGPGVPSEQPVPGPGVPSDRPGFGPADQDPPRQ
ncbi:hypothetical protein AMIS_8550 [Actinoplanes missouriensis 431]|uniref:Uncharacterized protein n=1 Tax=Actinoplanes missouriensis (strain ATCC 14538 / DSM 43046 / CBS 188.64 / JCM 3121 / NBRC 102363 / NCIMB 12654 / NRRL B-3342 / UNCC 431) TaxID=512565 RepID=I0GZ88_ACTM4|nr:hypothetical protein [Actinoplanes missouriensis]BAL86075.1 hypothetical protein AMIS_8550 [Actinoplanes missouriensis 431]